MPVLLRRVPPAPLPAAPEGQCHGTESPAGGPAGSGILSAKVGRDGLG